MGLTQTGRTTTLTPGAPPVNSGGSTIPVSPSYGGWSAAGNYGVPTSATGPTAGLNVNGTFIQGERGNFNIGGAGGVQGVRYPVSGGYQIPWGVVAPVAAGIVCAVATAGACTIASGVAAASPYIIDWLGKAGLSRNPTSGNVERPDIDPTWPKSDGYQYQVASTGSQPRDTREEACRQAAPMADNASWRNEYDHVTTTGGGAGFGYCYTRLYSKSTGQLDGTYILGALSRLSASNCPAGWYKTSTGCVSEANLPRVVVSGQEVGQRLGSVNPDPRVWGEVLDKGGTIEFPNPTVTGPSSVQGPETVKQNADGTKEVSRTTYNFSTAGNTVVNTSVVTTNNTYNSSNVQTGSTTTTTTPSDNSPAPEEPEDACTKHPEALGCQKIDFDTPEGEIPRESKDVSFQAESVLGGGSCPADVYSTVSTTGQTLKVWDWQATCNYFLPIRFILMALAAFSAVLIIMPGGGRPS